MLVYHSFLIDHHFTKTPAKHVENKKEAYLSERLFKPYKLRWGSGTYISSAGHAAESLHGSHADVHWDPFVVQAAVEAWDSGLGVPCVAKSLQRHEDFVVVAGAASSKVSGEHLDDGTHLLGAATAGVLPAEVVHQRGHCQGSLATERFSLDERGHLR